MTKEEIKNHGECLIAFAEGKTIQYCYSGKQGWHDIVPDHPMPSVFKMLRIKPEKKKRLLKVEELPPVFWVRQRRKVYAWELCVGFEIGQRAMKLGWGYVVNFNETALEHFEWSPDRKEVRSFEVEE